MPVYNMFSREFSDLKKIEEDILSGITDVSAENTTGFLICDSRINYTGLVKTLGTELPFPVVWGDYTYCPPLFRRE
jgi:hypothetical protein